MENKSEKLSQPRGTYGGLTTQCNTVFDGSEKGSVKNNNNNTKIKRILKNSE